MKKRRSNKGRWAFSGQGLVEYAILLALLALVAAGGLAAAGGGTGKAYEEITYLFGTPTPEPPDLYPDDRITIKVIDAAGDGIENIVVYMFKDSGSYAGKYTRTDENGLAEFLDVEDGAYRFRANLQGKEFWSETLVYPIQHFGVIQTGQMDFPVKVVDALGRGINNVRVYAYTEKGGWAGTYGNTGSDGIVTLPMVTGNFKFRAFYQGQSHYWSEVATVPDDGQATIYTGQKSFPVKVVDAAGNGISGVRVYAYTVRGSWSGVYANTGSDGIVHLDIAEGDFKFRAYYQGHAFWSETLNLHQATEATIKTGQRTFPVRVVDAAGNGISGVNVYAYTASGSWTGKYGKTGSNGVIDLDMAEGNFKFRAYYQGHSYWTDALSLHQTSSATIKTGQQKFSVRVVDAAGNGISNITVYAYSSRGSWTGSYGKTGSDGTVILEISDGSFKFRAYYQGQGFWSDIVSSPKTTSTTIKTQEQNFLVNVVSSNGKGISNTYVYAYTSRGAWTGQYGRTNASGEVNLKLVSGDFKFRIYHHGQAYWSDVVSVPKLTSKTIKVDEGDVNITVLNDAGTPLKNEVVYLYSSSGSYTGVWGRTGSDGIVSVSLAHGAYRVRARGYWSTQFSVPNTQNVKITVK